MYTGYMNTVSLIDHNPSTSILRSILYSLSYLIFLSEFGNIHIKVQFHKLNTVFICKTQGIGEQNKPKLPCVTLFTMFLLLLLWDK